MFFIYLFLSLSLPYLLNIHAVILCIERKYTNKNTTHLFSPQLLYNYKLSNKLAIGGSFVNLVKKNQINKSLGVAKDIFIILNILENKKYKIDITAGVFNPILWEPSKSDWYPTYSVDIKIK